jgi:hypothetical protein
MKNQTKRTQKHRISEQWIKLINEFDPKLQTINEYCQIKNIGTSSYYKWKEKLGLTESTAKTELPVFVPIQTHPQHPITQKAPEWDLELELGHGIILRLSKS